MKERITFFQKKGAPLDPAAIKINGQSLQGPTIEAVREDRLTIPIDELPSDLKALLEDSQSIHIRWADINLHESASPLFSRVSPGFHLFYTPLKDGNPRTEALCRKIKEYFPNVRCSSPSSFTPLPVEHFPHSAALQYYQSEVYRPNQYNCKNTDHICIARTKSIVQAVSLDISYDATSRSLKLTAQWPYRKQAVDITSSGQHRTEVGLLAPDTPSKLESHELGISGLLTVLGQDTKPSGTVFAFPTRHRDAETTFEQSFLQPTGLHPTLQIRIGSNKPPREDDSCKPYAYFTLPRSIFLDRYQLADELFLASKNLTALRYSSEPVDLEAPEYVIPTWGSAILLELAPPDSQDSQPWTAEVPFHLRYLYPSGGAYTKVSVPYPVIFWACAVDNEADLLRNPFERANLGYDGLFDPQTVFWHVAPVSPQTLRLTSSLKVPTLRQRHSKWIEIGTSTTILLGFAWVVWKLWSVYSRSGYSAASPRVSKEKKQK